MLSAQGIIAPAPAGERGDKRRLALGSVIGARTPKEAQAQPRPRNDWTETLT